MKISINTQKKLEPLGDLYGIFFEDLNHAADGGLYAEMIQNRSFEFAPIDHPTYHPLTAWEKIENDGEVKLVIETGNPVSHKNPHYLGMDITSPGNDVGILNLGYNSGINLIQGHVYRFSCYAKREQCFDRELVVSLRSKQGAIYAMQSFFVSSVWEKYEFEITATETDHSCVLAITAEGRGKVYLDLVSLFPKETFKGRRNGMRKDIATMLEALRPKFMRFPGGCLVHDGALDPDARDAMYRWKNTVGPIEHRPARRSNWGYNQTLGIGYFEYFQFCEDINAKPLPVLPGGWDPHHKRAVDLDKLQPWIDDALDLIEFATGASTSAWGSVRSEMGHPEPFDLEYIGIGNEEVGAQFFERYVFFHDAIRSRYPDIKIINSSGPFPDGEEYERGWKSARENKSDLVDEHYYCSPEWFLANHHRYDSFKKEDPKVFLGEYASWGNTYYNALSEATYMIGLERNVHAVALACYAPMLCNVDYVNWSPNLIWFNNHEVYGTPNYWVQKMFMQHQGTHTVETSKYDFPEVSLRTKSADRLSGKLILRTNESAVEYDQIRVTDNDSGRTQIFDSITLEKEQELILTTMESKNYTLSLTAKEISGFKGFNIVFAGTDDDNFLFWETGGWQNQDLIIGERVNGRNSCLTQSLFTVEKDKTYHMELKVEERRIDVSIDNVNFPQAVSLPVVIEPLYVNGCVDEVTGETILKVVNINAHPHTATIELLGQKVKRAAIEKICNTALDAVNSFFEPECIKPVTSEVAIDESDFVYTFEKESITFIRFS